MFQELANDSGAEKSVFFYQIRVTLLYCHVPSQGYFCFSISYIAIHDLKNNSADFCFCFWGLPENVYFFNETDCGQIETLILNIDRF